MLWNQERFGSRGNENSLAQSEIKCTNRVGSSSVRSSKSVFFFLVFPLWFDLETKKVKNESTTLKAQALIDEKPSLI